MRWSLRMVFSLLAVVHWAISARSRIRTANNSARGWGPAAAKPASPAAVKPAAPPIDPDGRRMQLLLAQWAKQSTQLREPGRQDSAARQIAQVGRRGLRGPGHVQEPESGLAPTSGRWLRRKGKQLVDHERIICTGKQVLGNIAAILTRFTSTSWACSNVSSALQEGPLPFLFNFQADEARKRYQMKLLAEDPKSYVISVLPLLPIDKEAFSAAWVELDKTMLLPTQIVLARSGREEQKFFQMSEIKRNAQVMAENFQGQKLGPPWKVLYNKDEAQPAAGPVAPEALGPGLLVRRFRHAAACSAARFAGVALARAMHFGIERS